MKARWLIAAGAAVVLVVLAIVFVGYRTRRLKPAPVAAPVVTPAPPPLPANVTLSGTIQATKFINVQPPVDGTIEQFVADIGDDVAKGDILARIHNPKIAAQEEQSRLEGDTARNRVQQIEADLIGARLEVSRTEADTTRVQLELQKAQKEFERQQMMWKEGVTPRLTFEKADQDYKALKTQSENLIQLHRQAEDRISSLTQQLETAKKTAEKSARQNEGPQAGPSAGELTSPADGVITARQGKEGDRVTKSTDLFQMAVELQKLQVVIIPDAQNLPRIHAGQAVNVEIKDFPGIAHGTVREVKAGQATIAFPSPGPGVRPGMTAQVTITF
jgi:HlyD family secretion protein